MDAEQNNQSTPIADVDGLTLVSRRAVIDKAKLRERYFETMRRLWQKEYTTKYKDLVKAIKELIDEEYSKYEK